MKYTSSVDTSVVPFYLKQKPRQNNVTVTVSLSCVSVSEAPGNVYLTIKYGTGESIRNRIKIERKETVLIIKGRQQHAY